MQKFNFSRKKLLGPLTFWAHLESNMRKAGCSQKSIAKFKELFGDPDPQSLYAQNILADLQANRYAPKSVKRHITRMDDFQKECYAQLESQKNILPTSSQLTDLGALVLSGRQFPALPSEIGKLTNLQVLDLQRNNLAVLPGEMWQLTNLQRLDLCDNQLADLPNEIGQLRNLRWLWLRNNRFTTVPRVLFGLPKETEINLQGNPLPDEEIIAVRQEMDRLREMDEPVPRFLLPLLAAEREANALRAAADEEMNVHAQPLTGLFKRRLDELAAQFPDNLKGTIEQQRAEMKTIEQRLFDAFKRHAAHHPHPCYEDALKVAQTMFEKGYDRSKAVLNDFHYSSGHALSYVVLAMEKQWAHTPDAQRDQARENGLTLLLRALVRGGTNCDTRHIEEVLQLVGIALTPNAQVNPELIGVTPVGLSAEKIRDTTLPVAKRTLRAIARQSPDLADDALQEVFRTTLTREMPAEHSEVTQEQINAYLDSDILPEWETFKELALDEEDHRAAPL